MNMTQGLYIFTVCQGERLYCTANLLLSVTVSGYMCGKLLNERSTEHRVDCVKEVVKKNKTSGSWFYVFLSDYLLLKQPRPACVLHATAAV